MTTSSRKDMYTVRVGLASSNEEALQGSDYEGLIGMSGDEIDMFIIEDVYKKEMEYHADNPEGQKLAKENYRENMRRIKSI